MLINEMDLFKGVSQNFMDQMNGIVVKESYDRGVFLFKNGDPASNFYILREGRICICAEDKGYVVSFVYKPGDFFGWSSLLDRKSYSASAECVVTSTVSKIEKEKLTAILQKDLASGLIFYKNFAGIVGGRFIDSYNVKEWFPSIET